MSREPREQVKRLVVTRRDTSAYLRPKDLPREHQPGSPSRCVTNIHFSEHMFVSRTALTETTDPPREFTHARSGGTDPYPPRRPGRGLEFSRNAPLGDRRTLRSFLSLP